MKKPVMSFPDTTVYGPDRFSAPKHAYFHENVLTLHKAWAAYCEAEAEQKNARIAALEAEIDALKADAKRLDWLDKQDGGIFSIGYNDYRWYFDSSRHLTKARAAIDHAMAQSTSPDPPV